MAGECAPLLHLLCDDPEALAGLMAAIYGPQYAMLRDGAQAVALAPEADSDDEIVE